MFPRLPASFTFAAGLVLCPAAVAPAYAGHSSFRYINESALCLPAPVTPTALANSTEVELADVDGAGDLNPVIGNSTKTGGAESLYIRRRNPGGA